MTGLVGCRVESWSIRPLDFREEGVHQEEGHPGPARRIVRVLGRAPQEAQMRGQCRRRARNPCHVAAYVDAISTLAAEVPLTTVRLEEVAMRRSAYPYPYS